MTPKERPILFSAPMVIGILKDRKTQTRRVIIPQPTEPANTPWWKNGWLTVDRCPHGIIGDHLWVKETWVGHQKTMRGYFKADMQYWDHATNTPRKECGQPDSCKWKPSIFMPRWASRITLEITDIRVQRVQEISEEDARAEGVRLNSTTHWATEARDAYQSLWDRIQLEGSKPKGDCSWKSNLWVWCLSFKRIKP